MNFTMTGAVKVTANYTNGASSSTHVATDFRLDVSKHLDQSQYNDKRGLPTAMGSHALTNVFVQGLIGNIHHAHKNGFKNDAEHLRYIIEQLERGFVAIAEVGEGEM